MSNIVYEDKNLITLIDQTFLDFVGLRLTRTFCLVIYSDGYELVGETHHATTLSEEEVEKQGADVETKYLLTNTRLYQATKEAATMTVEVNHATQNENKVRQTCVIKRQSD